MALGRLVLRMLIGGLFVGHGTQKLFGWFGGAGLGPTGELFESVGLRPGRLNAAGAGLAEAGGGALLVVGLATPLAAASLVGVMSTAIRKIHLRNGIWVTEGGFEYNAVLVAALTTLVELGPGPLSLDAALGVEHKGIRWALAALGCGLAGSAAVLRLGGARGGLGAVTEEADAAQRGDLAGAPGAT
jgi:putative oxidoreductase